MNTAEMQPETRARKAIDVSQTLLSAAQDHIEQTYGDLSPLERASLMNALLVASAQIYAAYEIGVDLSDIRHEIASHE